MPCLKALSIGLFPGCLLFWIKSYLENLVTKHQSATMDDSNETGIASRSMVIGIYLLHSFI